MLREILLGFVRVHVLHHAAEDPFYGAWMMEELAGHGYDVSPGTLYPILHRMEEDGYLESAERTEGGRVRRYYAATALGREALAEAREKAAELTREVLGERDTPPGPENEPRTAPPTMSPIHAVRPVPVLVLVALLAAACGLAACGDRGEPTSPTSPASPAASASPSAAGRSPDARADTAGLWTPVRMAFGQQGEAKGGYFRINLPRTDLDVRIGDVALEPGFDLTTFFGFVPIGDGEVMAMGEVILLQDEVPAALAEARRQGVSVEALHNHLTSETPRILFMHVMAQGRPDSVAAKIRAVVAQTSAPTQQAEEESGPTSDWSVVDAVLGRHTEAEGRTAEYVFLRRDAHAVHGVDVQSTGILETASEVVFQDLGGGRVANTGEFYVRPDEVQPVLSALESHGLHVTALHNHMLGESPPMFWVHWYATGEGAAVARGVAAALAETNSDPRASDEE